METHSLSIEEKQKRNKLLRFALIISIVLILFFTFDSLKRLGLLLVIVGFNFIVAFIKRKIPTLLIRKYFFGIEYILFSTVIVSVSFGPKIGAVMGSLSILANYIAERRISKYFFPTIIQYILIGYFSYFFRSLDIIILGIIITLIYNVFSFIFAKLIGANTITLVVFNTVNILFNIFLFTSFGHSVLKLLG